MEDIIFGSTNESMGGFFLYASDFNLSMMRRLNFIFDFQIKQTKDSILCASVQIY